MPRAQSFLRDVGFNHTVPQQRRPGPEAGEEVSQQLPVPNRTVLSPSPRARTGSWQPALSLTPPLWVSGARLQAATLWTPAFARTDSGCTCQRWAAGGPSFPRGKVRPHTQMAEASLTTLKKPSAPPPGVWHARRSGHGAARLAPVQGPLILVPLALSLVQDHREDREVASVRPPTIKGS